MQATSADFTRAIVSQADYLAFASRGQAQHDEQAGILRIVPAAIGATGRAIGVALRAGSEPSPDLQALLQALREHALPLLP